jgi:signal transduction histidine kinase
MGIDESTSAFAGLGGRGLVGRMHEQLDELLMGRDQMEQLLLAIVGIGSDLDLAAVLHRIVIAGMELTGARHGALGVRGADDRLMSFVHAGMDAETVRRIGHLPVGKGLLGVLVNQTEALRLDDLTQHPAMVGFPQHHPPMRAFLGVPITIRGAVFGSLYLADPKSARVFSSSDETAARALASAASVAIGNAQLFEQVRAAAKWTKASREITVALLTARDTHLRPLELIADCARELTGAEQAIVLVPTDPDLPTDVDALVVSAAVGVHAAEVIGQQVPVHASTIGAVFRSGAPVITESFRPPIPAFTDVGERPAIVMPLRVNESVLGVIAVARGLHQEPFDTGYLELVSDFADHAAIGLTLAAAREEERALAVVADRERIAHDLHDHVIQRLFAAGMDLQGTIARSHSPGVTDRLNHTLDDLQTTIEDIRTTIFQLQRPRGQRGEFRQRIQRAVADLTENCEIATTWQLSGPMSVVDTELAEHAEAVIIEAVSNTVRHSGASALTVEITIADELAIDIIDNGRGIPADNPRRSGLANLPRRAEENGGTCHISSPPAGGTHVHWTAPFLDPLTPHCHNTNHREAGRTISLNHTI